MTARADAESRTGPVSPGGKSLTIGAVCKQLEREFPDISISKIRYLEDQKLLAPRRTAGGYRLFSPSDVGRLRTILRLQRDEFLPLRVIRQELAAGRADEEVGKGNAPDPRSLRRTTTLAVRPGESLYGLQEVIEETGADAALVKELEEYGVIRGEKRDGEVLYDETVREIIRAVTELKRFGVGGATCASFGPLRTARRPCSSRYWRLRSAPGTRNGARRPSRRSRTSRRSPPTSSTCC